MKILRDRSAKQSIPDDNNSNTFCRRVGAHWTTLAASPRRVAAADDASGEPFTRACFLDDPAIAPANDFHVIETSHRTDTRFRPVGR